MKAGVSIVLIAAILFCAGPPGAAQSPSDQLIRIGIGPGDAFAEAYYAQQMGFFRKAGLRIETTKLRSGATIATGVAAQAFDVGISNLPVLVERFATGTPFVLIAGGGLYSTKQAISALCVAATSKVRGPRDLIGKTVAVAVLNDQSHLGMLAWLEKNHVDPSRVHFIAIPFDEMPAGMSSGLADAAVLAEPWLSVALRDGKFRVLSKPYDAVAPQFLIGIWFTTRKWYAAHPDLVRKFVNVVYETAAWANAHHEETAKLLAQFTGVDLQTVRSMTRTPYATSLDPADLQPALDLAYKYHTIDRPISVESLTASPPK